MPFTAAHLSRKHFQMTTAAKKLVALRCMSLRKAQEQFGGKLTDGDHELPKAIIFTNTLTLPSEWDLSTLSYW
jgi:hypothetical protein